jgi:hypothetical protein
LRNAFGSPSRAIRMARSLAHDRMHRLTRDDDKRLQLVRRGHMPLKQMRWAS